MLTYFNYAVQLQEVPDEISLVFYIAGCPHHCVDCSSPWLQTKGDYILTDQVILNAIAEKPYASCVVLMGGDADHEELARLADTIHRAHKSACVFSGDDIFDKKLASHLDYYKVGSWQRDKGPLNCKTTNQHMYYSPALGEYVDITYKYQTKEAEWRSAQEKNLND